MAVFRNYLGEKKALPCGKRVEEALSEGLIPEGSLWAIIPAAAVALGLSMGAWRSLVSLDQFLTDEIAAVPVVAGVTLLVAPIGYFGTYHLLLLL